MPLVLAAFLGERFLRFIFFFPATKGILSPWREEGRGVQPSSYLGTTQQY